MSRRCLRALAGVATAVVSVLIAAPASARPLYFDNFTALYGFTSGDDLYSCGVCHRRWEGTGARNPYGLAVEQQLYLGKTITNAILDVEGDDTDLDGFSNADELTLFGTLPGYSCDNFTLAINPPPNFQSLITPGVPSCLEPMDLRVEPTLLTFVTAAGTPQTIGVALINYGTDFPITVSAVSLLPGAHPSLSLSAPPAPFAIPVGATVTVEVTFAPADTVVTAATLRVTSDDPDEPIIDVPVTALGFVLPLAPAAQRQACLQVVDRQYQKYSKRHLGEWMRCYVDEVRGRACDTGRRDLEVRRAEEALRRFIGGSRDQQCAGQGLTPVSLGLPATCGGACDHVAVNTISAFANCLVCRQEVVTSAALSAAVGTPPPDLPANFVAGQSADCQARLAKALRKGIARAHRALGSCELANITASSTADCATQQAAALAQLQAKVNVAIDRCRDTTGLQGCLFEISADPTCLGTAAANLGADLVDAAFGLGN